MSVINVEDVQVRAIAEVMLAEADEDARVCLAQSTLASRTGLSPRTLRRALDRMIQAGWVEVEDAGSSNSTAIYRVERLRRVAVEAGWNTRRASSSGVLRCLSAEEAKSPLGTVHAGERLSIAPGLLIAGENVRGDLRLDEVFVDTVRALGVLKDIDVYPTLTGLVVLDGHRRLRAAIDAGLEAVTVRVVEVGSEQERIATQLVENDAHLHTGSLERARAVQQLMLFGMNAKELRRHGVSREEAAAAKKLVEAPTVVEELADTVPHLDLVTLGKIADLAETVESAGDYEVLVRQISDEPSQAEFLIEEARQEAKRRAAIADLRNEYEARGIRVVLERPALAASLPALVGEDGKRISEEEHEACPGHVVWIRMLRWEEKPVVDAFCMDWKAAGHRNAWARNTSGATSGPMSEEEKKARAALIEKNRRAETSGVVRQAWVRDFLIARRRCPKEWALLAAPVLEWARVHVSGIARASGVDVLRIDLDEATKPEAAFKAERGIFKTALAAMEGAWDKSFWRETKSESAVMMRLYMRSLEAWGYPLSEVEKSFCEAVESESDLPVPLHAIPKKEEMAK